MGKLVVQGLVAVLGLASILNICLAEVSYRSIPLLQSTSDTVRPLALGFTYHALLPWFGTNEPPALLVMNHGGYFENRSLLYRAAGKDGSEKFFPLPADYPVYDRGRPLMELEPSTYIPIPREDGLFDLIRPGNWIYYINTGTAGAPEFKESYSMKFKGAKKNGDAWVADVTGDGVPDALVAGLVNQAQKFHMYPDYPKQKGPWAGVAQPNMGSLPDTDIQNFRGYDIAGNWLGLPVRKYLWWAKGAFDGNGELGFGEFREVRCGETDYPVQWQCFGSGMSPVAMDLEGGLHIILFSGIDQAYALPVRGEFGHELRVGKAEPLLKDALPMLSVNHPKAVGVGDLNMDGIDDLVIGSGGNGRFTVLSGTAPGNFKDLGNIFCKGGPLAGDTLALPVRRDWNKDGYPDVIVGGASGELSLWNGTADPLVYEECRFFRTPSGFIRHRPVDGNLQGDNETAWSYIQPDVFDWDGDGNLDLITNDNEAKLFLYQGTGSGVMLKERKRFMRGAKPLPVAWRSRPAVIDGKHGVSGDDRPCLFFTKWDNKLAIGVPETKGSLNIDKVIEVQDEDGMPIVLSGPVGLSGRTKFSIADWDNDGVWDVVFGSQRALQRFFRIPDRESPSATPFWMRNVGTNDKPVFQLPRMITFKDGSPIKVNNHNFNIWPTDLNGDGLLDMIFGDDEGFIFYLYRDQLEWNEDIEEDRKMKKLLAAASVAVTVHVSGETVFSENWDYTNQTISAILDGGEGWSGGWQASGEMKEVQSSEMRLSQGVFASLLENGCAVVGGEGKRTTTIKRCLAKSIDFNPENETTFTFSMVFSRTDKTNNDGTEVLGLFELASFDGEVLCAVETGSKESLILKLGGETVATADQKFFFDVSYMIQGKLILRPEGENDELFAKLESASPEGASTDWDLKMEMEVDGVASLFQQRIMKYAGRGYFDNLQMQAE